MSDDQQEAHEISQEIAEGIEALANDVFAKHSGGVVVGFTGFLQYMDEEGDRCFSFVTGPGQTVIQTCGHLAYMTEIINGQLRDALGS